MSLPWLADSDLQKNHPSLPSYLKKLLPTVLFLLSGLQAFAQITGIVVDKATGLPIPYANIQLEHTELGATSNEQGHFKINAPFKEEQHVVILSLGYTSAKVKLHPGNMLIELLPKEHILQEVTVRPQLQQKVTISDFSINEKGIGYGLGSGEKSWIIARYFPYSKAYEKTPYLEHISLATTSRVKNAKFRIRLLAVTEDGTPGEDLLLEQIIAFAPKGFNKEVKQDVSRYNVKVPETGFFIAYEWFVIDQNKKEITYTMAGSEKKYKRFDYSPTLIGSMKNSNDNIYIYSGGKWQKSFIVYNNSYSEPLFRVVLSN